MQVRGLLGGLSGDFLPDRLVSRADFITALGKLAEVTPSDYRGSPSFADVKESMACAPYVKWAEETGILSGEEGKRFYPERALSRKDMAVMLDSFARAMGVTLHESRTVIGFGDLRSLPSQTRSAVLRLQKAGVVNGFNGSQFKPSNNLTRGEACAVLRRFVEASISPSCAQGWTRNASGNWFYYEDGSRLTGWKNIGGKQYYFGSNGTKRS